MHDDSVPWTLEGLTGLFASVIERGKGGYVFVQAFEAGLPWSEGIKFYTTGVNGTHAYILEENVFARSRNNAGEIASFVLDATQSFPSWRCLDVNAGPQGVYSVTLYGGRYTNPAKP